MTQSTPTIVVVGSNHEYASVDVREKLAFSGTSLVEGLQVLRERTDEGLIVSTCNRTEIYASGPDVDTAGEAIFGLLTNYHEVPHHVLQRAAYTLTGDEAIQHMLRVASGLDSMVLGEPQILTQIREALDEAREAGSAGPVLQRLATEALRIGKKARTETDISRNRVSIAHAAVDLADQELDGLEGKRVVVLGAGEMGSLTAKVLRTRGVSELAIVNRSLPRAHELAEATGGVALPLTALDHAMLGADLVFGAVQAPEPMIRPERLGQRTRPLLLVDLGVPRVIDPAVDGVPEVTLRDVDALESIVAENRRLYAEEMRKVEILIDRGRSEFGEWLQTRVAADGIARYRAQADEIRENELDRAMRKLAHLSDRDRNVVRALAVGVTNKMAHTPVQSLRNAGSEDEVNRLLDALGVEPRDSDR